MNVNHLYFLFEENMMNLQTHIQGVFEVEAFLLTCDSMRYSKEF
jgi:hypothetical protein